MATVQEALNLGLEHLRAGRLAQAELMFRRVVEVDPAQAAAWCCLGMVCDEQRKFNEAVAHYQEAIRLEPAMREAHNNLGNTLRSLDRNDEAVQCYRRAVQLDPQFAHAYNGLGVALLSEKEPEEAIACFRRALELVPDLPEALSNLGAALQDQGQVDESMATYQRALQVSPNFARAHSNVLGLHQYCPGVTLAGLAAAHAEFERRFAAGLAPPDAVYPNVRDPDRPLRLGFVSRDLGKHPVGYFLVRVLENLDRGQWETICYSDRLNNDRLTTRIQAATAVWREVYGLRDERLWEQIRSDRIDILFDLAGHTAHNRLLVFAHKPAPIQITWLGYVGTTGLSAMDYILADRYEIPSEAQGYYREKVLCLPDDYVCYDPPLNAPEVGPLPARTNGYVTFGCFNNLAKITPDVIRVWAEILRRTPGARLVLKYAGFNDRSARRRYQELFAAQGIAADRLEILGYSPHAELLSQYNRVDIALDPFPYSGGLTTCEALWMGVPVVTCPGETFASRHSLSHLSNVGLTETIARDFPEYIELAVRLAADEPRLAELRGGLRQQVARSPLCDGKRFAANIARLLRGAWQAWCG